MERQKKEREIKKKKGETDFRRRLWQKWLFGSDHRGRREVQRALERRG